MIIMVIGIPVQSVLALIIALLLNKKFPGSKIVVALFMIPVMITPVVAGFEWKIILDNRFGPLNYILGFLRHSPPGVALEAGPRHDLGPPHGYMAVDPVRDSRPPCGSCRHSPPGLRGLQRVTAPARMRPCGA